MSVNCPSHDRLLLLVRGQLDDQDLELIANHLDSCPSCLKTVQELSMKPDSIVQGLREKPNGKDIGSTSPLTPRQHSTVPSPSISNPSPTPSNTVDVFRRRIINSRIVSRDDLKKLEESLSTPSEDVNTLAQALLQRGWLTEYQIRRLLKNQQVQDLVLDEYILLDEIGHGGMGMVYKARHRKMKRVCALKMLPSEALNNPESVDRFYREVEAAGRLIHPNIVTAYDAGEANALHYLALEYVDGSDLNALVKANGPVSPFKAADYLLQAARGLEYAHSNGIVHRDIKPGNMLVDKKGRVKILDLGLARITAECEQSSRDELTTTGQVMGTIDYMAPEQAVDTKHADERSDIYSLGCTLYRLIAGRTPFSGESMMNRMLAHRDNQIPSLIPHLPNDSHPELLNALFQRMLAKQPDARPQTMGEVAASLEEWLRMNDRLPSSAVSATHITNKSIDSLAVASQSPFELKPSNKSKLNGESSTETALAQLDKAVHRRRGGKRIGTPVILAGFAGLMVFVAVSLMMLTNVFLPSHQSAKNSIIDSRGDLTTGPTALGESSDRIAAKYILAKRGMVEITMLSDGNRRTIGDSAAIPSEPFAIKRVTWILRSLRDEDLKVIESLPEVSDVQLQHNPQLTNRCLASLATCPKLSTIQLTDAQISDEGLKTFENMTALDSLSLTRSNVTAEGISDLVLKKQFSHLSIGHIPYSAKLLSNLERQENLNRLGIPQSWLESQNYQALGRLKKLNALLIFGPLAEDDAMRLSSLKKIKELVVEANSVNQIVQLQELPLLLRLRLAGVGVNDEILLATEKLSPLKFLTIDSSGVSQQAVDRLKELRPDLSIDFQSPHKPHTVATGKSPDRIAAEYILAKGGSVFVIVPNEPTPQELKGMGSIPIGPFLIKHVDWSAASLLDTDLKVLADLRELTKLFVPRNKSLTNDCLTYLMNCPRLTTLDLEEAQCNDQGLKLLANLPALNDLSIYKTQVTAKGMQELLLNKQFVRISLGHIDFSPDLAKSLAQQSNLFNLGLHNSWLEKANFSTLRNLPKLNGLAIIGSLSDDTCDRLATLTNLKTLGIQVNSPMQIRKLINLPNLESLTLYGQLSDDLVSDVLELPNLKNLRLATSLVSQKAVDQLLKVRPSLNVSFLPPHRAKGGVDEK